MNVIFLDIDGVLNTRKQLIYLFETAGYDKLCDVNEDQHFDPEAIGVLEDHIEEFGTKIVISSTWRFSGLEYMRKLWEDRSLPGEIVGITPVLPKASKTIYAASTRGEEIQQYLHEHPEVEKYAIIDDDDDILDSQLPYFIHTTFDKGLERKQLEELNKIFKL